MNITILPSVEDAQNARGVTVVIDVFRAFTTEAYVFGNGCTKIIPVRTLEEAYSLKKLNPEYILMGERKGIKPEGFDYGNSPTEIQHVDFSGKTVIHTTSNGTQGLLNATNASHIIAGSFVTAGAIVEYIRRSNPSDVSLVATAPDTTNLNEDLICAGYIKDELEGKKRSREDIELMLKETSAYRYLFTEIGVEQSDFDLCLDLNRFNFVILGAVVEGRVELSTRNISL